MCTKKLKSKNVFIDTSIYIQENFNYLSENFKKLKSYSLEKKIKLFIHDIVIEEIKSNIAIEVNKGIKSLEKAKRDGKIFRNLPQEKIFTVFEDDHDSEYYKKLLFSQLEDFIKSSNIMFIPSNYNVNLILKNYFSRKAPFGEGKKKS